MQLAANVAWFTFSIESEYKIQPFAVYEFSGKEEINLPYEFTIELVAKNAKIDLTKLLGKNAVLSIADRSGAKRYVHGLVKQIDQLHTANEYTHYRCQITHRLWFLSQTCDHRIFQHKSVLDIIGQLLKEHRFFAEDWAFKCCDTYEPREYCVQYGESALHFITRLCEESAIYFYFEHTKEGCCLCFSDREGGPLISGESDLRFFPGSGQKADTAVVRAVTLRHRINSDKATYREYNFENPPINLEAKRKEPSWAKAPVPQAMELETYQFPHLYQRQQPGDQYANLQLLRQLTFRQWIECESDVSRFLPGFTFNIHHHQRQDVNIEWWVVSVTHHGQQPQALQQEAPSERGMDYQSTVVAIPDSTRFVPEIKHPKQRVEGLQSAVVTGPDGEEVFVDRYGRIKAQFHWDRCGKLDEHTTCWVRVADCWAGENFGFIQLPRIGQEILIEYMEGDPDRPVVTGRVYNAERMPPWILPSQKTLSGIQSREFKSKRRNQLVLDDTQGQIQAQLSSEHDLSQLNLGYLTRVNNIEGRKDFRGEGFELRTDGWGAIRTAKGLYIGTDKRINANSYHKDISEAVGNLQGGESQHTSQAQLAVMHNAQDSGEQESVSKVLTDQNQHLKGSGQKQGELTAPHIVLSSPAGLATTTPESTHMHNGKNMGITTGKYFSFASGKSILGTALERISLFAHKMGIKIFAGKGKIEIQAQSDDLDIIAEKVMRLISAKESIQLAAPKEISLIANGSYIKLNGNGIEMGTSKKFTVYASKHEFLGPKSATSPDCPLPSGIINDEQFVALDADGVPLPEIPFRIVDAGDESQVLAEGVTDENGCTPRLYSIQGKALKVIWDMQSLVDE